MASSCKGKERDSVRLREVRFIAEQIGFPENEFKLELVQLFHGYPKRVRAYLAQVEYDGCKDVDVAICLRMETGEDEKLTENVAAIFKKMFGGHEHLDIIFLKDGQEAELREVCCPFFHSESYQYETADFYLTSSEGYGLEEIRSCFKVRRLLGSRLDGYMLCDIIPPIIGQPFGLGAKNIAQVVFASRHGGYSIFSIQEWPMYVHVARPLSDLSEKFSITETDLQLIGWGELFKMRADATQK